LQAATHGTTSPLRGIYRLAGTIQRTLPTKTDDVTHEFVHPSVLEQENIQPLELQQSVDSNPAIVTSLLPIEQRVRESWPLKPGESRAQFTAKGDLKVAGVDVDKHGHGLHNLGHKLLRAGEAALHILEPERMHQEGGEPVYDATWIRHSSPFGKYLADDDPE
jgi:hypothetical protein